MRVRIYQHKSKEFPHSFTSKYNCDKLVYCMGFASIEEALLKRNELKVDRGRVKSI
ncbi:MAG: hypothetical protein ACHQD9_06825 [Chitinophagales bacterium]